MARKQKKEIKTPPVKKEEVTSPAPQAAASKSFSLVNFKTQALILCLVCLIFYANTFNNEAAFDDAMAITGNEYVQQGVAGIKGILSNDAYQSYLEQRGGTNQLSGGRYRPLPLITFAIEQEIMGTHDNETADAKEARTAKEMHARHVVNVLLYILSILALLQFLRYVVFPGYTIVAFLATLLFAIHPIHTEVVANVKSRDEILSVLFICLTFTKAFRYLDQRKVRDLVLALVCLFLALLSKEYAVTLVALLPLSFFIFRKEVAGKALKNTLPYLAPVALYFLIRLSATSGTPHEAENNILNYPYLNATTAERIASQVLVLLNYLRLLVFPHPLVSDYSYSQIPYTNFSNPVVWLSAALYIGLIVAICLLIARRHLLGFALTFYLVNLLLISNLFVNIGAPMGERLVFHSSIGFSIALAYLLFLAFGKLQQPAMRSALAGVMVLLICLCGYKTMARNADWKNNETLFLTDVKWSPNSALVNNNVAGVYMSFAKRDKSDKQKRNEWFTKAIQYFDKTIQIYPRHLLAHMNRGLCYYNMGLPDKALPDWDTVRVYAPATENLGKYLNIASQFFFSQGIKYRNAGNADSAIVAFGRSADANPAAAEPLYELGNAYYGVKRYKEAGTAVDKALKIAPAYPDAMKLNELLKNTPR